MANEKEEYWPGKKGVLKTSIIVPGTNIEIIRPYDGRRLTHALFDFDGTLSLERNGWIDLMIATNSPTLAKAVAGLSLEDATRWVVEDVEESAGTPTYLQMKRLADYIIAKKGFPKEPREYKEFYVKLLKAMVAAKHQKVMDGKISLEELIVNGATELLEELVAAGFKNKMYLASGTDIGPVNESAEFLEFGKYFDKERIIAAGSVPNPEVCAKKLIIEKLVNEQGLKPGELLTFGDNYPEMLYTHKAGGICVGVRTPHQSVYQKKGYFTLEKKRNLLINAGAHILVPDYTYAKELVKAVQVNYLEISRSL